MSITTGWQRHSTLCRYACHEHHHRATEPYTRLVTQAPGAAQLDVKTNITCVTELLSVTHTKPHNSNQPTMSGEERCPTSYNNTAGGYNTSEIHPCKASRMLLSHKSRDSVCGTVDTQMRVGV